MVYKCLSLYICINMCVNIYIILTLTRSLILILNLQPLNASPSVESYTGTLCPHNHGICPHNYSYTGYKNTHSVSLTYVM